MADKRGETHLAVLVPEGRCRMSPGHQGCQSGQSQPAVASAVSTGLADGDVVPHRATAWPLPG